MGPRWGAPLLLLLAALQGLGAGGRGAAAHSDWQQLPVGPRAPPVTPAAPSLA
eukprot:SAG22_NODE_5651_length_978_cov_0.725825_2_plen_52_part_01